jgi:hypothetical protein
MSSKKRLRVRWPLTPYKGRHFFRRVRGEGTPWAVFQLGPDGFDEAVEELASTLEKRNLNPDAFLALNPGQSREWVTPVANATVR